MDQLVHVIGILKMMTIIMMKWFRIWNNSIAHDINKRKVVGGGVLLS